MQLNGAVEWCSYSECVQLKDVKTILLLQYGEAEYWDHRYQAEPVFFDWYLGFGGLQQLLKQHVPEDANILQVSLERWFVLYLKSFPRSL
jgi:hypothetical protein